MTWRWKNFTEKELSCKHCGAFILVEEFMDRLQALRLHFGKPMIVNSGYRCSTHNTKVSSTGPAGPHTTGRAVDIKIHGPDVYSLAHAAIAYGFTGIGIKQHGPIEDRFIHLDDLPNGDGCPRPRIWSRP